eukprot:scaffold145821_cov20-Tisochrysis_lutea.AAC.1
MQVGKEKEQHERQKEGVKRKKKRERPVLQSGWSNENHGSHAPKSAALHRRLAMPPSLPLCAIIEANARMLLLLLLLLLLVRDVAPQQPPYCL